MDKEFSNRLGNKLDEIESKLTPKDKEEFLNEMYNIIDIEFKWQPIEK